MVIMVFLCAGRRALWRPDRGSQGLHEIPGLQNMIPRSKDYPKSQIVLTPHHHIYGHYLLFVSSNYII